MASWIKSSSPRSCQIHSLSSTAGSIKAVNLYFHFFSIIPRDELGQALVSVQTLVFDLAQLTCQKRFDCRNVILRSSAILLGTSYSQIVVAVLLRTSSLNVPYAK